MRNLCIAVAVVLAVWGFTRTRRPGHAHILRFYASTGAASPGQSVRLCYAVENVRTVRISPLVSGSYPARDYCLDVAPEHTTHFTLMAEGYDGSVDTRSFTLPVQTVAPVLPASTPPAIASVADASACRVESHSTHREVEWSPSGIQVVSDCVE